MLLTNNKPSDWTESRRVQNRGSCCILSLKTGRRHTADTLWTGSLRTSDQNSLCAAGEPDLLSELRLTAEDESGYITVIWPTDMSQDFNVSRHVITFLQEPEHIGLNPNTRLLKFPWRQNARERLTCSPECLCLILMNGLLMFMIEVVLYKNYFIHWIWFKLDRLIPGGSKSLVQFYLSVESRCLWTQTVSTKHVPCCLRVRYR